MEKDTIYKVISVVCAICLWAFVVSVVNPPTTVTLRGIPVTLTDQEILQSARLAIAGDGQYKVDVVIKGSRNDVSGITSADVTATASLAGLTPGQSYITVSVNAPTNVTVDEIRTERIQVYVDEYVTEEKPLSIASDNVKTGYELTVLSQDGDKYRVSGAKSLVDMVKCLKVTIDAANIGVDENAEFNLPLKPVDNEGNEVKGVIVEKDNTHVVATVHTVKTVPLYSSVEGTPGLGATIRSSNIPSSISIKGTLAALSRVSYLECEPINIEGITEDTEFDVVPLFPEGVMPAAQSKSLKANVTLADTGSMSIKLRTDNAEVKGLAENLKADVESISVDAVINASLIVIKNLEPEEVVIVLDLTGMEEGTYQVPIAGRSTEGKEISLDADPSVVSVTIRSAE